MSPPPPVIVSEDHGPVSTCPHSAGGRRQQGGQLAEGRGEGGRGCGEGGERGVAARLGLNFPRRVFEGAVDVGKML